jgi:hypothetical protein
MRCTSRLPIVWIDATIMGVLASDRPADSVAKIVGEASRSAQTIKLRQFTRRFGTNLR